MQISRRDALLGATAAAIVTGAITAPLAMKSARVKAALTNDAQALAVFRQLNSVRRDLTLRTMRLILKVQRTNERNGFTTEDDAERALDLEREVAGMQP